MGKVTFWAYTHKARLDDEADGDNVVSTLIFFAAGLSVSPFLFFPEITTPPNETVLY
jgi:hypothetical protein